MTVVARFADSVEGRAALAWAVTECEVRKADLLVLAADGAAAVDEHLTSARTSLGDARVEVRRTRDEDALEAELVDLSYEETTELLVIGVRRRSPVGKLLLGSSSQRLLLDASCPVVAVKPPVAPSA